VSQAFLRGQAKLDKSAHCCPVVSLHTVPSNAFFTELFHCAVKMQPTASAQAESVPFILPGALAYMVVFTVKSQHAGSLCRRVKISLTADTSSHVEA